MMLDWMAQYWELISIYWLACALIIHETLSRNLPQMKPGHWVMVAFGGVFLPLILIEVARVVVIRVIRESKNRG